MTGISGPQPDDGDKQHQVRVVEPRPHDTPPVKEVSHQEKKRPNPFRVATAGGTSECLSM
eukprot:3651834-Rhodomonas_salina.1